MNATGDPSTAPLAVHAARAACTLRQADLESLELYRLNSVADNLVVVAFMFQQKKRLGVARRHVMLDEAVTMCDNMILALLLTSSH